jgi:iron complex transport system substrate-binding protein
VRIASLIPSATETLFALGLEDDIVAVTHECDYPPAANDLPHLTRSIIEAGLPAAQIDREVRERTQRGDAIYALDANALLAAEPDLIVTQALCPVCAVSVDDVRAIARELDPGPEILSLDPATFGEVLADIRTLGVVAKVEEDAEELLEELADRIDAVQKAVAGAEPVPVVALEWLDPVFLGGHWVPQMVELAGGIDVLGLTGERSRVSDWDEVRAAQPRVAVAMPCGFDLAGSAAQVQQHPQVFDIADRVVAVDASGHFSRPGPRLVDGVEALAAILHPDRVDPAIATGRWAELERVDT